MASKSSKARVKRASSSSSSPQAKRGATTPAKPGGGAPHAKQHRRVVDRHLVDRIRGIVRE